MQIDLRGDLGDLSLLPSPRSTVFETHMSSQTEKHRLSEHNLDRETWEYIFHSEKKHVTS